MILIKKGQDLTHLTVSRHSGADCEPTTSPDLADVQSSSQAKTATGKDCGRAVRQARPDSESDDCHSASVGPLPAGANPHNPVKATSPGDLCRESSHPDTGGLCLYITDLRAQDSGEQMSVGVLLRESLHEGEDRRRDVILPALYGTLGLRVGPISPELLEELEHRSLLSQAIRRGVSLLGYGTNSAGTLLLKLRQRGFDASVAREALDFLKERGYLREDSDSRREAERCLNKLWGPRRIAAFLRTRGYDAATVRQAMDSLEDTDFAERCSLLTARHFDSPPTDPKEKQKIVAFLLRYGYEMSDIRYALRSAWASKEN